MSCHQIWRNQPGAQLEVSLQLTIICFLEGTMHSIEGETYPFHSTANLVLYNRDVPARFTGTKVLVVNNYCLTGVRS